MWQSTTRLPSTYKQTTATMELTPIKMRGKGPRKQGFKQPTPKRLKVEEEVSDSQEAVYKKDSAAPIEQLPTEILHRILLFSQEPNFPRASLRIGSLLSHASFYTDIVFQAFAPTWDMWLGCKKRLVSSYTGWFEDHDRFGGDPELQVSLLIFVMALYTCHTQAFGHRLLNTPPHLSRPKSSPSHSSPTRLSWMLCRCGCASMARLATTNIQATITLGIRRMMSRIQIQLASWMGSLLLPTARHMG